MKLLIGVAALLLALPAAHAALTDDQTFPETSMMRVAVGDIPRTTATEPAGQWNVVEYQRVHDAGTTSWAPGVFALPAGNTFDGADCTCGNVTVSRSPSGQYQVDYPASVPAGDYVIAFRHHHPLTDYAFNVRYANGDGATKVNFYLAGGYTVLSNVQPLVKDLESTAENPGYRIWQFQQPDHGEAWFVLTTQIQAAPATGPNYILVGVAFLAGAVLWAFLVARGLVQKKTRKQEASVAAHVEAAATDSAPVLEGKKRALLAALKEVELARQANEMPVEVYDVVKADLKKQAVTVMRALETGSGKA